MVTVDLHTHTVASGHGTNDTIADMAKAAAAAGIRMLGITDHGPATLCAGTPSYFRSLHMAPKERAGVHILYGIELNILDGGAVDLEDSILAGLDYAIASMHRPPRKPASAEQNTRDYLQALENPYVRVLGHCDNTQFPCDYTRIVEACARNHVIVEINNASLKPNGYHQVADVNTKDNYVTLLTLCKEHSLPILLSSDSHGHEHIGETEECEALVRQVSYPEYLIVNSHPDLLFRR